MLIGGGALLGFQLPLMSIGLNLKRLKNKKNLKGDGHFITTPSSDIPGTQTNYMKAFRCSHNLSDNEFMSAMDTLIVKCKSTKKPLVAAGCVPQVVEETSKGYEVCLLNRKTLPALDLPKTKYACGHLGSYTSESLIERVRNVVTDGVKGILISSEDTGAYGRSNSILTTMNREYTMGKFRTVVHTLYELVPEIQIVTDIICGLPSKTEEDFAQTLDLIRDYKFPQVQISQFYPRPRTPAAGMKKVPSNIVKKRSRELTSIYESFTPYEGIEGRVGRIWITKIATDGVHLVVIQRDRENIMNITGSLLTKRKESGEETMEGENSHQGSKDKQIIVGTREKMGFVDWALIGGMLVNFTTFIVMLLLLGLRTDETKGVWGGDYGGLNLVLHFHGDCSLWNRSLVDHMARVNTIYLSYNEKLAFHILAYIILLPPFGGYDAWKITSVVATPFDFDQTQSVRPKSHCVAIRVTSEDLDDGFKPASGKVQQEQLTNNFLLWGSQMYNCHGGEILQTNRCTN
ncbi:hypothetical protein GIB67_004184 [Kingdonia uniflora]|uniref:Elp3/MiaA/NifB-like radical SAM core domain-containing protein n=1 Tax=Kingdonia uniflora TaxID=39325 RepID=A0A7J7LLW0_9MAGN|nr:hypothetical protein GIB67_004184 [Kingdonia uniflora]